MAKIPIVEISEGEPLLADLRATLKALRRQKTYVPLVAVAALVTEVLDQPECEALGKYLLGLGEDARAGKRSVGRVHKH